MADISQVKLPDGTTYNLKDSYVRTNYRALNNNDFDTINVTELNAGDLIVTGAARFLNTINGSISGNAVTATKATQDESGNNIKASYASSISISDHTITLKNKNGVSLGTVTVPDNNTTYSLSASGESVVLSGSDNTSTTADLSTAFANYMPKAGGTFTGRVIYNNVSMPLAAGKVTGLTAGTTEIFKNAIAFSNPATSNDLGWIRVLGTGESDTVLEIATGDDGGGSTAEKIVARQYNTSNAIAKEAILLAPDGTTSFPVSVTAPKFIGNLQGNADTWDGYHCYYDRYKYTYEFTQPTADTIWYVKIATADWNSNLEIIQIRTQGNNKTGSHVLHTGARGTSWWGYGQVYSHRGVIGVRKSIGNADNVYLKLEASCTSCKIYTSFEASVAEIVTDTSTSYTAVPENGGFYGNVVTADEFAGNATSATAAQQLAQNGRMDYGWNGINYFNLYGTAGAVAKTNDTPTTAWWHIMRFNHANNSGYYTDLAIPFSHTSIYYKRIVSGAVQNDGWIKVWDQLNLKSETAAASGTTLSLVTTGEKATWNAKASSDTKNTAGSTDTSSKIFLIGATSQAANPQTYSDDQVYVTSGTLQANNISSTTNVTGLSLGVSSITGTTGGISLYGGVGNVTSYGIAMRGTGNGGKHGAVQGDWAIYNYMLNYGGHRGWIWKNSASDGGNVASIDCLGNAVFNGYVGIGGNTTNTSGVRQVYNSTTKSLDFVFVA